MFGGIRRLARSRITAAGHCTAAVTRKMTAIEAGADSRCGRAWAW